MSLRARILLNALNAAPVYTYLDFNSSENIQEIENS